VRRARAWRLAAATAGVVVAVDQATKQLAIGSIDPGESVNVFFGIDLVNVRNTGVAFGALSGGGWLVTVLTLAALSFLLGYFALRSDTRRLWIPVGTIVGGALGNLADRARDGAVIDFIDPAFWPAFNVADIAIVLGILGLLYVADTR
jgi:signal peptidase II